MTSCNARLRGLVTETDYPATAEELVQQYGGYPVACTNRVLALLPFSEGALERADLVQAGMLGLVEAYRAYDPERGASFRTFAWIACRNAIWRTVQQMYVRHSRRLGQRHEQRVEQDVRYEMKATKRLGDLLPYEEEMIAVDWQTDRMEPDDRQAVVNAVRTLPPRQELVIVRCEVRGDTLQSLATELGVTRERARQLRAQALNNLRKKLIAFADTT